ncbi:MAG: hypothetical protein NZM25_04585 [Leptospiraceae bacterium]|nr:hypothetical protein [Leptospiraceae bacterium]MDW8305710.1 hypothetical protein [Leptospiraceae bacterium]
MHPGSASMYSIGDLEIGFVATGEGRGKLFVKKAKDEKGIVYRLTAVLYVHDWNIMRAMIKTSEHGQVQDEFEIESKEKNLNADEIKSLQQDFEKLFLNRLSVVDYLSSYPDKLEKLKAHRSQAGKAQIQISESPKKNLAILRIKTKDRPGLLLEVAQVLYLLHLDIVSLEAGMIGQDADDIFYIRHENNKALEGDDRLRLLDELRKVL